MIGAWRIFGVSIAAYDIEYTEDASKSESFLYIKGKRIRLKAATLPTFFLLVSHEIRVLSAVCLVEMQISSRVIKQKRRAVKKQTATAK